MADLFQEVPSPSSNFFIQKSLLNKTTSPDVILVQSIIRCNDKNYLIPVALSLRSGANANSYISVDKSPPMHILAFIYTINLNSAVANTIQAILISHGSSPSSCLYEDEKDVLVQDWLLSQKIKLINKKSLNHDTCSMISIVLDHPPMMPREYQVDDGSLCLRSFSEKSLENIPITRKSLDDAITCINVTAFDILLRRGLIPSYVVINRLVLLIREYYSIGQKIIGYEILSMLLHAIRIGAYLDVEQYNVLLGAGSDVVRDVNMEYNKPKWSKICSSPIRLPLPEEFKSHLYALNIHAIEESICSELTRMSRTDKEKLRNASRYRQSLRMASDLGRVSEFMSDDPPLLVCKNKLELENDPLDYNDLDVAYYRDDNNDVWCFTSDMFEALISSGTNPYDKSALPVMFIDQLRYQLSLLKHYGIVRDPLNKPVTYSQALDGLEINDQIDGKESERVLAAFFQLAKMYNISEGKLRSISKGKLQRSLNDVIEGVRVDTLTDKHALITTAYVIMEMEKTDKTGIAKFMQLIKS